MHKVLIIDLNGAREAAFGKLDLDALYDVCCKDTPDNKIIELVGGRFGDKTIDIWCHEEGRLYPLPVTAIVRSTGEDLCGPVLIAAHNEDGESIGLTSEQLAVAKEGLIEIKGLVTPRPPRFEVHDA